MTVAHAVPVNDLIEHDTENFDECICGPDIEYVEDGKIVVHHSLDGREKNEP
jgi:hypothetical protein